MNSYEEQDKDMPSKKRAKVELCLEDYCTKRTNELTQKLEELAKDFPEMKHVLELSNLCEIIDPAVRKYKQEVEAKKRRLENESCAEIYRMLPDEMLTRCLSFVGKGHYVFVGSVSKRFRQSYIDAVANEKKEEACRTLNQSNEIDGEEASSAASDEDLSTDEKRGKEACKTFYQAAASNVSVAKYCFDNESIAKKSRNVPSICCGNQNIFQRGVRENILFHAAMKGKVDIIKLASYRDILSFWETISSARLYGRGPELYYYIERIAEAGHLNILQCLKDDFDMHLGLYKASRGAASGGHLHILEWLKKIDCLREDYDEDNLCHFAISRGQIEVLEWLQEQGIPICKQLGRGADEIMTMAINSKNTEMIAYCYGRGFDFGLELHSSYSLYTENIHVVRYCHEHGCEITDDTIETAAGIANLDIWKYLRSKSIQWHPETTECAAALNRFDLLKYAHEDGCEWAPETWNGCIQHQKSINWDMMNYLYEKKCPWNPFFELKHVHNELDRVKLLNFLIEKKFPWTEKVLLECIKSNWLEEIKLLIENTPLEHMTLPESLSYIAKKTNNHCDLPTYQYLFSKGIPFSTGNDKQGFFLSRIARQKCNYDEYPNAKKTAKIIKWALENDCPLSKTCDFVRIAERVDFRQDIIKLLMEKILDRSNLFRLVFFSYLDQRPSKDYMDDRTRKEEVKKLLSLLLEVKCPQPTLDELFQLVDAEIDASESENEVQGLYDYESSSDDEDIELYHYT